MIRFAGTLDLILKSEFSIFSVFLPQLPKLPNTPMTVFSEEEGLGEKTGKVVEASLVPSERAW